MAKDNRFVGLLSFHSSSDNSLLGVETCTGKKDAKTHAGYLATQYGTVDIKKDGITIASVDETYIDALMLG